MKTRSRRVAELIVVLITIAVVSGIAIPMLAKSVAKARTVAVKYNLSVAEHAVDEAVLEDKPVNAATLKECSQGITWVTYAGETLPDYRSLSAKQLNTVYVASFRSGSVCIFSITPDGYLEYSIYAEGSWCKEGKVKFHGGSASLLLSMK